MNDTRDRLIRCFQAIFPLLTAGDAPKASSLTVGEWDSVATVTLAATVEEEFDMRFEEREIEKLNSFQAYLDRLDRVR